MGMHEKKWGENRVKEPDVAGREEGSIFEHQTKACGLGGGLVPHVWGCG